MRVLLLLPTVVAIAAAGATAQLTPYASSAQEPDRGVHFPLPQELDALGRRKTVGPPTREGQSNALTVSWDGRVVMYVDSGASLWANKPPRTKNEGYLFSTFDKTRVTLVGGAPDFSDCFGTALPRFAAHAVTAQPDVTGTYPEPGEGYPNPPSMAVGSMGELGLLDVEFLSANLYPADTTPAVPGGQNPYPGDANGVYASGGGYRAYDAWVTLQDLPKFWDGGKWHGYTGHGPVTLYEAGAIYPNAAVGAPIIQKRNGLCRLLIVVQPGTGGNKDQVTKVVVKARWQPMTVAGGDTLFSPVTAPPTPGVSVPTASTMYVDNFEPNLTHDGHLMVGKGSTSLCNNQGPARLCFYYNPVPFAATGWRGPWELTKLYDKRDVVLAGATIGERYPLARRPLRDYDGTPLTGSDAFEGGYPWLDPDGRFVVYTCETAGVGMGHPETLLVQDGGGSSNRAHVSLVGSVTGWQQWRIDHAAVNATRHMFTGWDQDSRTTYQRTASFGFSPGFWEMLRGAPVLPRRDDGALKLQLVNNQLLRYYEGDLSPYQERDYGFYLPMTEMLQLQQPGNRREVDVSRTPDLSGRGHAATVIGGKLPCEYFDLPSSTKGLRPGLDAVANSPLEIHGNWTAADCIVVNGKYWAKLADWVGGKPPYVNGTPLTSPHTGRGAARDFDSDVCWGRVGQAMFFPPNTRVRIANPGASAPELHPGTAVAGASTALTASLWVRPLQARNTPTDLLRHHVRIGLQTNGALTATITSAAGAATTLIGGTASIGAWTHVAVTWAARDDGKSDLRLYVDGAQVATALDLAYPQLQTSTQPIDAGCLDPCAMSPTAVLLLDEVALKNSALAPTEIANLALLPQQPTPGWPSHGFPAGPFPFTTADERVTTGHFYDANLANIGADLFHDVQLSSNKRISCATCHQPGNAFTDGIVIPNGVQGTPLLRNTPTIYNTRYTTRQFWDARAIDLEDQSLDPVFDHDEMGFSGWNDIGNYLSNDPGYTAAFQPWLTLHGGGPLNEAHVRQALATYMRLATAGNAPADQAPLAFAAGKALFEGKARCNGCHSGPGFTDGRLWTTGTFRADGHDDGAFATGITTKGRARFRGAFKTPTLRELTRTGPYFHDGHAASLDHVIDFYDRGGVRLAVGGQGSGGYALTDVGHDIVAEEINRPLRLTTSEKTALRAYLDALTAGAAGSTNGPAGHNSTPVLTLVSPTGGPPYASSLTVDVVDADGAGDFDSTMTWTLHLVASGGPYGWNNATKSLLGSTNGFRVQVTVPVPLLSGDSIRIADHHGRWSNTIVLP